MDIAPPAVLALPFLVPDYVSIRRECDFLSSLLFLPKVAFHPELGEVPAAAFARLGQSPSVLRD